MVTAPAWARVKHKLPAAPTLTFGRATSLASSKAKYLEQQEERTEDRELAP